MIARLSLPLAACLLLLVAYAQADAPARLPIEKLAATHDAAAALAAEVRPVKLKTGYGDYRAVLHAHSLLSHDSRSPVEEVVAAAKTVGVQVVMFTEHPAAHYDYFKDGHRGLHDGVLLIPGAETNGFLAYPTRSIQSEHTETPQQFADLVRRDDGLIFLCHLEERMDWNIAGLTGSEIYNTHADLKDEKRMLSLLKSPLGMLALIPALQKYPQEFFAAMQDYPADYLRRYDELSASSRLAGVAGNDSHHNQGVKAILQESGKVLLEDRLGQKLAELDPEKISLIKPLVKDHKPGDVVLQIDVDPYERSFHHVSTHLLMNELSQSAVWEALKSARAYVAFDWIADPSGFAFVAADGEKIHPIGSDLAWSGSMQLKAEAPLAGLIKLIRDGQVVKEERSRHFEFPLDQPGIYRLEVWQNLAGELRPWILSNPIYIKPAA